jgi:DNA polymerase-3 subunit gamma/tau
LLKLIEATNLKSIDEIIEQIEKIPTKPEIKSDINKELKSEIKKESNHKEEVIAEDSKIENSNFEEISYIPFEEETNNNSDKYQLLIEKVYDRDPILGECFEKNFIFAGFSNNILNIISYAKDEERQLLFKYFGLIKTFAQDIFGSNIELNFKKEEATLLNEPTNENDSFLNETGSMIEDIELGSGCVADMTKSNNEAISSKELQIDDILNSKMLNKAKELFDIKKITVKSRS